MSESHPMDPVLLHKFLVDSGVDVAGDLDVALISGGRSNLTYSVTDGTHRWVARRPPTGGLTPSAHDMKREWTVTKALQDTDVPVAGTVAADLEGEVLGAPFTVVDFVDGLVVRDTAELAAWTDEQVDANATALVDGMARLHAVDYEAVGLGGFGRPVGYIARQVALWARQWEIVQTRALPDVAKLHAALAESIPENSANTIVHGDYRVDNTILGVNDPGSVLAVVDWELSALGDPLADVALMCAYRQPIFNVVLGAEAAWTSDRYPSADELAQRYATASGNQLAHWDFYMALANFKIGVIGEGITHRARSGADSGAPNAARAAEVTGEFIAEGLKAIARARR